MRYPEFERFSEQLLGVLRSPMERFAEIPPWGRAIFAAGAALATYVAGDVFRGAVALVVAAGVADYVIGVRVAVARDAYDPCKARLGWQGKATGIVLLLLIRGTELWISSAAGYDTKGWLATAAAISLLVVDLQSIAKHREQGFGAQPIPVLSQIFGWLQAFARAKVPAPPTKELELPPESQADDEAPR